MDRIAGYEPADPGSIPGGSVDRRRMKYARRSAPKFSLNFHFTTLRLSAERLVGILGKE